MGNIRKHIILLLLALLTLSGCTEQYVLQSNTFESALVVEATLTNEMKRQTIRLTRTYQLEANAPTAETGAHVTVNDSEGNEYTFEEMVGHYVSTVDFEAVAGRNYWLNIETKDGRNYTSTAEVLSPLNPIQDVTASVQAKDGARGVGINVKCFDPTRSSQYYRYEYEESYKIIAPVWDDEKTILTPFDQEVGHQGIAVVPRTQETQICYATVKSNDIIQNTTTGQSDDRVDYRVRFISDQNYIISHRYSIKVRQYVQNLAAYTFYKTLKKVSGNGSLLSQTQPGYFFGNLKCVENPTEKVIGYFEVASVSEKRIFFNYVDLFPNEPLPPYIEKCDVRQFKFCFGNFDPECRGAALLSIISSNSLVYVDSDGTQTYFFMVKPACGDCTTIGSNVKPDFWID
jgi:ABC-type uncharacterized transport system auxiliary subunit